MTHAPEAPTRRTAAFWDQFWRSPANDNARHATHAISARLTIELLRGEPVTRILDVGCGMGEIVILVGQQHPASLVAVDVSERAAAATAAAARTAGLSQRVHVALADCYHLGFADSAFDAVISFGYASAASYEGAETEVARVLRPGGVAIIDFRNVSLYNTLLNPGAGVRMWRRFQRRDKVYHFGPVGLAEHFSKRGLQLEAVRYFNTYPPLGNLLPVSAYLALDDLGRRVGRPLGRVLIAKFRRTRDPL